MSYHGMSTADVLLHEASECAGCRCRLHPDEDTRTDPRDDWGVYCMPCWGDLAKCAQCESRMLAGEGPDLCNGCDVEGGAS